MSNKYSKNMMKHFMGKGKSLRYIKKPAVIEAWQFNGEDGLKWPEWLHDYLSKDGAVVYLDNYKLYIPTLDGRIVALPGDYIIKDAKGEIYPVKPYIFEASYDPVDEGKS